MALSITSMSRVHPAPCDHWEITLDIDGNTVTKIKTSAEILEELDDFPGGHRGALVAGWIRYQLENGATKNDLLGLDIAPLARPSLMTMAARYVRDAVWPS